MNSNKQYNPKGHNRRTNRLRNYDYSRQGLYFLTICTKGKECLFGDVENGFMVHNELGSIASECWMSIPQHFPLVILHDLQSDLQNLQFQKDHQTELEHFRSLQPSIWQRNFHDHIIRNEEEYFKISNYILNNPRNWDKDKFYKKTDRL